MPLITIKYTFIITLLFSFNNSIAQTYSDSLIEQLNTCKNDSIRINLHYLIAWNYRKSDAVLAKEHAKKGINLSTTLNRNKDIATGLNRLGIVLKNEGTLDSAILCYQKALKIEIKEGHTFGVARAYHQLSKAYKKKGDEIKALQYARLNLEYMSQGGTPKDIANSKNGLAILLGRKGEFKEAIVHFKGALSLYVEAKNLNGQANVLQDLGNLYDMMGESERAIKQHKRVISIFKKMGDQFGVADTYNNLGNAYFFQRNYKLAEAYYNKSLLLKTELGDEYGTEGTNYNLALILESKGEHQKAIELLALNEKNYRVEEKLEQLERTQYLLGRNYLSLGKHDLATEKLLNSYKLAKGNNRFINLLEITKALSKNYSRSRNFPKAYQYISEHDSINEALNANYRDVKRLEEQVLTIEKEKIELVKNNEITAGKLRESKLEEERSRLWFYGIILLVGVFIFAFLFWIKGYRKQQQLLLARKESAIKEQEFEDKLKENELSYRASVIEAQEEERKKISEELHDNLGGLLSTVKVHFKNVEDGIRSITNQLIEPYQKANELLDKACEEIRVISHKMAAVELEKFGLIIELDELFDTIRETGRLKIDTSYYNMEERLPITIEREIYKTIRELTTNIIKHAGATEVFVSLTRHNGDLTLMIEDNGVGFDYHSIEKGLGFIQIEQRINRRNGNLNVDSGKGNGTTISIDLVINEK